VQKTELRYFACANSCRGFINYFPSVLRNMDRIFILKGGPGTGKSTLMKRIGWYFSEQGEPIEYIYCSSDSSSLDGIILREKRIAVVDGTAPHVIEPTAPGACEEYVNLGVCWDREKLVPYREEILDLQGKIKKEFKEIYSILAESKKIYDRWSGIYRENRDEEKLEQVAESVQREIFRDLVPTGRTGMVTDRFFAALTPEGMVHYIENLTEGVGVRYFLKGAPGTGKSELMKALLDAAEKHGVVAEVYHSCLDADQIGLLVLRELDVCIFDAMPPWEVFPSREGDIMVDLYTSVIASPTEDENQATLSLLLREYEDCMRDAGSHLARVHHLHDALEEYYIHAVNFNEIEQLTEDIITKIE